LLKRRFRNFLWRIRDAPYFDATAKTFFKKRGLLIPRPKRKDDVQLKLGTLIVSAPMLDSGQDLTAAVAMLPVYRQGR
jgi:hypothetical protein